MKELTVQEFKQMLDGKENIQVIDVREPSEYSAANIKGELIPLATIPHNVFKVSRDKKVIVYCRSGKRSENAIRFLEANHGFENLYNLKGGILAYKNEIDGTLRVS
jgi:sulfur-carrier protein adenylyltransferase/sulfurtransferase